MRRLMLLRHAKSDRLAGVEDHDRPLADRGEEESRLMGLYLARHELVPDLALASTARRAHETCELACAPLPRAVVQRRDRRIYAAAPKSMLELVRGREPDVACLLLVGHNPGLHELCLALVRDTDGSAYARLRESLPTAGLVVIDFDVDGWEAIAKGTGRLERFVTPATAG